MPADSSASGATVSSAVSSSDTSNTRDARERKVTASTASADARQSSAGTTGQFSADQLAEIEQLASRDQEVRIHERAHAAVGGQYAGAPTYRFSRGPDGKTYAIAGEVSIDISAVPDDPQATLAKAERVQRAALAPADPSPQDRAVAAAAAQLIAQAQADIAARAAADTQQADATAQSGDAAQATDATQASDAKKKADDAQAVAEAKAKQEVARKDAEKASKAAAAAAYDARLEETRRAAAELGRRLIELGVLGEQVKRGGLLDATV